MRRIDRMLSRLPQSTGSWTCPWFLLIAWISGCVIASGFIAWTPVGRLAAVGGIAMLLFTISQRDWHHRNGGRC